MKKAFIILAYKDPEQIERLVKRLYHPNFHFYLHVDLKFDLKPFEYLEDLPNLFIVRKRAKMIWASYRFIEVLTEIMEDILHKEEYDFISPFSGQDYPIQSTEYIYNFFLENKGKSFVSIESQGSDWYRRCAQRYEKYHSTYYTFKGASALNKIINVLTPKRRFPMYQSIYGGPRATWSTYSNEAVKYIIKTLNENRRLDRFGRWTWAPDEFLYQTIIMNSHLKEKVVWDSKRYIDWSLGGPNPKVLGMEDASKLIQSKDLFARKFDIKVDTKILDFLDSEYDQKENLNTDINTKNYKQAI